MRFLKLRLALAILGFAVWTAWLAYQAYWTGDPIVLSRPQVVQPGVVAIVEARIEKLADGPVAVKHVYRGSNGIAEGSEIYVDNLLHTRGFTEPGDYLLVLKKRQAEAKPAYSVAAIPESPGFPPSAATEQQHRKRSELLKPPIYLSNRSTRVQLESILKSLE